MSQILYYSSYCENCKKLLEVLSKSQIKEGIHFLSIDRRTQKSDGSTYIILENAQEIILPPTVNRVPALLLINQGHKVLFGEDIYNHLKPIENTLNKEAVQGDSEPSAFMFNGMSGVVSDNFSFLDQTSDSLSARGDGGMRQLYNYSTISEDNSIQTPPDSYIPDKIDEKSLEQLQMERNKL